MFQQKNNQKVFSGPFRVSQDLSWLLNFVQFQLMKFRGLYLHSCMFNDEDNDEDDGDGDNGDYEDYSEGADDDEARQIQRLFSGFLIPDDS